MYICNPFIIELRLYILNPICYILNLINLKHLQLLNKRVMQLKNFYTYVFAFVATPKWCFNVIN
jgi:hypothetical protein